MQKAHYKLGSFSRVAQHLYRYSGTRKYYAVFKFGGKTKWISLSLRLPKHFHQPFFSTFPNHLPIELGVELGA
ncbi:MAG: hypothetical protein ABSH38_05430 [Verrucomicrobiota bacterium]|jgi:hypothetical protein